MRLVSFVFVIALAASLCNAQFKQGDFTLQVQGAGVSDKDFDSPTFAGTGAVSYFLTNEIEASLRQSVAYVDDEFTGRTAFGLDLHFPLAEKWDFFVGAVAGVSYGGLGDLGDSGFISPEIGTRYFIGEDTFLTGVIGYELPFDDLSLDNGRWALALGIGWRF